MAGREAEFGAEFSEGRDRLGLRRDEQEQDTLLELIGTTWSGGGGGVGFNSWSNKYKFSNAARILTLYHNLCKEGAIFLFPCENFWNYVTSQKNAHCPAKIPPNLTMCE